MTTITDVEKEIRRLVTRLDPSRRTPEEVEAEYERRNFERNLERTGRSVLRGLGVKPPGITMNDLLKRLLGE